MPVDYSKWDALELSDDSDFEPHPNVDKRSFIRAKQAQIHQQRAARKARIDTLRYERLINDGLLRRIDALLGELKAHASEAAAAPPEQSLYQALIASAGDPDDDAPPPPPEGVHTQEKPEDMRYSQMMGSLVDQVKKQVDEERPQDVYMGYVKGVEGHKKKVAGLQKELAVELAKLEKEEAAKITSESIHDGFNSSFVAKAAASESAAATAAATKTTKPVKTVEVLNPAALQAPHLAAADDPAQSSGADADIDEDVGPDRVDANSDVQASALGKRFAKIPIGDYAACFKFISEHRSVLAERETDGLLMEAFDAQTNGNAKLAKQCVHQALLLQYCRSLGPDGVQLFFKRITTPNHQARKLFLDDVDETFQRIKVRVADLLRDSGTAGEGVEQIQLQAVEPGSEIHINVPAEHATEPVEQQARAIFETFPPNFQKALISGSLDRVNEVLGKMSVDEAEEIVQQLGDSGMLDVRQGVIDGTTEEGLEELKRMQGEEKQRLGVVEEVQDAEGTEREGTPRAKEAVMTPDPD